MSDTIHEAGVRAWVDGHELTLEPIRVILVTLEVREVESTIPCGFQAEWGAGDAGGKPVEVYAGAGFGSRWGSIQYEGKNYCFDVTQLLKAFIEAIEKEDRHGS